MTSSRVGGQAMYRVAETLEGHGILMPDVSDEAIGSEGLTGRSLIFGNTHDQARQTQTAALPGGGPARADGQVRLGHQVRQMRPRAVQPGAGCRGGPRPAGPTARDAGWWRRPRNPRPDRPDQAPSMPGARDRSGFADRSRRRRSAPDSPHPPRERRVRCCSAYAGCRRA